MVGGASGVPITSVLPHRPYHSQASRAGRASGTACSESTTTRSTRATSAPLMACYAASLSDASWRPRSCVWRRSARPLSPRTAIAAVRSAAHLLLAVWPSPRTLRHGWPHALTSTPPAVAISGGGHLALTSDARSPSAPTPLCCGQLVLPCLNA